MFSFELYLNVAKLSLGISTPEHGEDDIEVVYGLSKLASALRLSKCVMGVSINIKGGRHDRDIFIFKVSSNR